jgi:chromosome segregation ATPase
MWKENINYEDYHEPDYASMSDRPNPLTEFEKYAKEIKRLEAVNREAENSFYAHLQMCESDNTDLRNKLSEALTTINELNRAIKYKDKEIAGLNDKIESLNRCADDLYEEIDSLCEVRNEMYLYTKQLEKINLSTKKFRDDALEWQTQYNLATRELAQIDIAAKEFLFKLTEAKHLAGDSFYFDYIKALNTAISQETDRDE